ncbi:MAG TPA: hypothetical protein VLE96_07315 [Chlamydiales bacterium]|nr:hypothetical protein [Chlamydiales bacterium]
MSKPRSKPGKIATSGQIARDAITKAKPVNERRIAKETTPDDLPPKMGRGGERAHWDMNYQEGIDIDKKRMPNMEPEQISEDGTRRFPRKRR